MPKRTRDKQLAKLAARRQAERRATRRRRNLWLGLAAGAVALILLIVAASAFLAGDDPASTQAASVPPSASLDPSASPAGDIPKSCSSEAPPGADEVKPAFDEPAPDTVDPTKTYTATIDTSCGAIQVDLLAGTATEAVNSFVFLAEEGFYDGLTWHRLVEGFVIQGGDPEGVGTGGPGYETPVTVTDGSSFDAKGVVAFAHAATGGNGSQFFITLAPTPSLDPPQGEYTIFGNVTKGMDVVETIGSFPVVNSTACPTGQPPCAPSQPVYINSITIEES
ncbi:MAG TPA: peptidylprolyl isomerase [Actinomycetota bacterium]